MSVRIHLPGSGHGRAGKVDPALDSGVVSFETTGATPLLPAVPPADRRPGDIPMSSSSDGPHRIRPVSRAVPAPH
ncbi:hypothetical protein ASF51_09830 [Agreia sp. Leaf283]|nr:hypothetical protein ASF51_09830 [Agreia sp. Leaf283]